MNVAGVLELLYLPMAIVLIIFLYRWGKMPRTYVTDYMRGLRFVKGAFVGVIGPGSYKPFSRGVHIETVDMRPVPFLLERITYRDALESDAIISVGAELSVDDAYLAATSLKDRVGDSLLILREKLRSSASGKIADRRPEFRAKLAESIEYAANEELRHSGMKVSNVVITEMFSRSSMSQPSSRSLN